MDNSEYAKRVVDEEMLVRLARRVYDYSRADSVTEGSVDAAVAMAMLLIEHLHYRHADVQQAMHAYVAGAPPLPGCSFACQCTVFLAFSIVLSLPAMCS